MSAKLTITIAGKPVSLDAKEARRIFEELRAFFGEAPSIPYHVPYIPNQGPQQPPFQYPTGPTCIPSTGDPLPFPGSTTTCQSRP